MASLSLVEDWPAFSRQRERMVDIFGIPSEVVMQLAPEVLEQIREEGPQCSLDYDFERKTDWAWGPTRVARACLEGLFKMGRLGVDHRVNNRRYFDLIENLLPDEILQTQDPNSSLEDYQRWHVLRRIGAIGLAHPNAGEHWNGILGVKSARRREILQELVEVGDVLEIEVENLPGEIFYLRQCDQEILHQAGEESDSLRAALLAPLDNLLWDRKSIQRLFGFEYVWEVYKPKKMRKYGYYVLPVIYGDQFVGRLDPSFDKKVGLLTINDWWWESGIEPDQAMKAALQDCLRDFMTYLSAEDLSFPRELVKEKNLGWLADL
jgi:uncharacterized protein YcaQ